MRSHRLRGRRGGRLPWLLPLLSASLAADVPGCRALPGGQAEDALSPYAAVRCGFRIRPSGGTEDGAAWRHLPLELPMTRVPGPAQRELAGLLASVESELQGGGEDSPAPVRPSGAEAIRSYELAGSDTVGADLEVQDAGGTSRARAIARVNGRQILLERDAPALLQALRRASLEALRASMERPRRPLEWSPAALAGFLGSGTPGADEAAIRRELIEDLRKADAGSTLAEVLIEKAALFPEVELAPLREDYRLAPRLLALTGAAARGDARALSEILTLSLEYQRGAALFERSLRSLFPRPANPDLHARHPESRGGPAGAAFLREIQARLPSARHHEGKGWVLEV